MDSPGWRKALEDIDAGRLGIARDRLASLVVTYPDELYIREKLGEVYHRLGYPVEAGRFWALVEDPTPEQAEAIKRFLINVTSQRQDLLKQLRLGSMSESVAAGIATRLGVRYESHVEQSKEASASDTWIGIGCWLACISFVGLAIVGLITIIAVVFGWRPF